MTNEELTLKQETLRYIAGLEEIIAGMEPISGLERDYMMNLRHQISLLQRWMQEAEDLTYPNTGE